MILDNNVPVAEPVTLEQAKAHLRVDHDDDDALIAGLISAAREHCESYTQTVIAERLVTVTFDGFKDRLDLGVWPVKSVEAVQYEFMPSSYMSMSSAGYSLDAYAKPAVLKTEDAPQTTGNPNCVVVQIIAGMDNVPKAVTQAMLLLIGHLYENRESQSIPDGCETLLQPHRLGMGL